VAALPPQPIGQSQSYLAVLDRVSDSAALERPVLLVGEHGTGKDLIAKRLHFLSPRWEKAHGGGPLRARRDDILPLADHFGRKISAELGADRFPGFAAEASEALLARRWPGNVRELKTVVERNTAKAWLADESLSAPIGGGMSGALEFDPFASPHRLRDSLPISVTSTPSPPQYDAQHIPVMDNQDTPQTGFQDRVHAFERKLIDEAMRTSDNHQGKAAKRLGLTYHQFRGLMRKHGLKK